MTAGRRCRRAAGSSDRGAGTVLVLAIVAAVLALLLGALQVTRAVAAAHQARTAADLAAIAGATRLRSGDPAQACAAAEAFAARNGAALQTCSVLGQDVWVTVAVTTPGRWLSTAVAEARAGPR